MRPPVIVEIARERERQISGEGYNYGHDDAHHTGDIARLACMYANPTRDLVYAAMEKYWGDVSDWLKHKTRRRDLIRAAALIVAEIERLDRSEEKSTR
jgi:hypothetical protein